jgi:hypothetical protein
MAVPASKVMEGMLTRIPKDDPRWPLLNALRARLDALIPNLEPLPIPGPNER